MTLSRDEVTTGIIEELATFERLVRSLSDEELHTPSRCEGWTTADVAAHVIGTLVDIVEGRFDGLGSPEVTAREVEERRGRSGAELADELAGATKSAADLLKVFDDAAWNGAAPGGYEGGDGDGVGAGVGEDAGAEAAGSHGEAAQYDAEGDERGELQRLAVRRAEADGRHGDRNVGTETVLDRSQQQAAVEQLLHD